VAWIRLKAGQTADEEGIRTFCRERLAYYKIPEYIRFVESYPMTLSGKVQKFKMREFEISARGLEAVADRQTA
jgi:fatty-acyl-CoA synthase